MRIIKFRSWDREDHKWLDHPSDVRIELNNKRVYHRHDNGDYYSEDACGEHDIVLMQFTGLLDKYGKEIYEGDVVLTLNLSHKTGVENCEVLWNQHGWRIKNREGWTTGLHPDWVTSEKYGVEVLGNLYEHPELLDIHITQRAP